MTTKKGNAMMITLIIVAVAAIGIIGYMLYSNNQAQQAADAQLTAQKAQTEAAQKEAQEAKKQQAAQEAAVDTAKIEIAASIEAAARQTVIDATATCEENLATTQKNLPALEDYADLLEKGGEIIEENPDEAIEQCRTTHEGLSKGECDTKVNNFVAGKEDLYKEIQAEITVSEEIIAAGC